MQRLGLILLIVSTFYVLCNGTKGGKHNNFPTAPKQQPPSAQTDEEEMGETTPAQADIAEEGEEMEDGDWVEVDGVKIRPPIELKGEDKKNYEEQKKWMNKLNEYRKKSTKKKLQKTKAGKREHDEHGELTGIFDTYPGTNWCGKGHYKDELGSLPLTDSCCRQHDLCKFDIPKKHKRWGYKNFLTYTISACSCDDKFRDCLKKVGNDKPGDLLATHSSDFRESLAAGNVGRFYFNFPLYTACLLNVEGRDLSEKAVPLTEEEIEQGEQEASGYSALDADGLPPVIKQESKGF